VDAKVLQPSARLSLSSAALSLFLRVGGDAMHNLICWCPKTQQPIDLQLYIDGVSLALIWSNPVRFQCPRCGADHETKVGAAHLEPLYSNLVKRSLKPLNTSAAAGRSQRRRRRHAAP
jgi:hypothetical protein